MPGVKIYHKGHKEKYNTKDTEISFVSFVRDLCALCGKSVYKEILSLYNAGV